MACRQAAEQSLSVSRRGERATLRLPASHDRPHVAVTSGSSRIGLPHARLSPWFTIRQGLRGLHGRVPCKATIYKKGGERMAVLAGGGAALRAAKDRASRGTGTWTVGQ